MNETVKDPVCHMEVPVASHAVEYTGIHFAFCSEQCKERFLANPRLYIGLPGVKSPAQRGVQVIKRRSLVLSAPLDVNQTVIVERALLEMMGINEICVKGDRIEIQYDLMQVTAEQIADKLSLVGTGLGGGWMERLKLGFINYHEECEIGNLEVNSDDKRCH